MTVKRKIESLQLDKAFFVPGFAELKGRTLNQTSYPGIQILMVDGGFDCKIESSGRTTLFFVPFNKVEIAVYSRAEAKDITDVKAA